MVGLQSSFLNYQLVVRDLPKALERKAAEPIVARDISRFTEVASGIHTVDDLFEDDRTYGFAVKAYGMDELAYARALIRKVISEGTGESSYAGRLQDNRYLALAGAFQLTEGGGAVTVIEAKGDVVAQRYRENYSQVATRAVARIEDDVVAYKAAVKNITNFDDLVNNDTALIFSLRANGLDRFVGQLDEVRKVVLGAANKFEFDDSTEAWHFDEFRATFGIKDGAVNYQDIVVDRFRQAVPKFGETLTAKLDEHLAAFNNGLAKIETVDQLMKNWDVLSIGLRAYGLEGLMGNKTALAAALKGDSNALRFTNADEKARFALLQAAFSFDAKGNATTASVVKDIDATVKNYLQQTLELDLGAEDNNVRLALNFRRRASEIKSVYDILADGALAEVMRTAFGIPAESAAADIDAQARMIKSKINIEDFQDPEKVEKLISRFLLLVDAQAGAAGSPLLSLFDGSADNGDNIYDLLQARANLR
ncbi:DUF1217 domain-containing protein [Pseudochelatococcus sp. G4_1912]|uniref:DUF1217 domain-containing protein n=1 Tax=Pseudochelatococcus sp. G4_1912 TaxID=3114288 RepID=UPI0039C735B8